MCLHILKGQCHENHFKNLRVQKHIYNNGNLQEVVHFQQNNSANEAEKRSVVITLTTGTQALNFQVQVERFKFYHFHMKK